MGYLACVMVLFIACVGSDANAQPTTNWVVDARTAVSLDKKGALVLDARSGFKYKMKHVDGAVHAPWKHFSKSKKPNQGELLSLPTLQKKLVAMGVTKQRTILVVGDPKKGWGEEGRIVWMLRSLGHKKTAMVDGGFDAMVKAGAKTSRLFSSSPKKGNFTPSIQSSLTASSNQVKQAIDSKSTILLDTRERREYLGKTPYGESRGGHVPSAKHLHYRDLLTASGTLLPKKTILAKLKKHGITPSKKVITYCTGGVRSGWLVVVLHHVGFPNVQNYAGSMWQWSSMNKKQYPLSKK